MFKTSRLHQPGWLSGGFHVVIIVFAAQTESAAVWPYALAAMSVVSFCAWAANYRRYRQIHDLPTSKVSSAAQGYVELAGRSELLPGDPVMSMLSRTTCCWYAYQIEEKDSDDKWSVVDSGKSTEQFLLVDNTGQCVISPDGAEVFTKSDKSWSEGRRRYSEWLLLPKNVLYTVGEFSTTAAATIAAREERTDVGALLDQWKKDPQQLTGRFDLNRDGVLDMKEWELARLQAQREVRKRNAEMQTRSVEGVHLLRKPRDGRLFLIANELPDALGNRYRFWSWVHLVIFFGTGIASLILL